MSEKFMLNYYDVSADIQKEIIAKSREEAIEKIKERNKDAEKIKVSACKVPELIRSLNNNHKQKGVDEKNE